MAIITDTIFPKVFKKVSNLKLWSFITDWILHKSFDAPNHTTHLHLQAWNYRAHESYCEHCRMGHGRGNWKEALDCS